MDFRDNLVQLSNIINAKPKFREIIEMVQNYPTI